jgi:site-specific recombinase XerC
MQWHRRGKALSSMLVVVAVIAACFVAIGCISTAETTEYDQQFREMVLSWPMYSITVSSASLLDTIPFTRVLTASQWKGMTQQVLAMSDTNFEEFFRSHLVQMIAYARNPAKGVRVQWNADVVSTIVSRVAPDLQAAIDAQVKVQSSDIWIHEEH